MINKKLLEEYMAKKNITYKELATELSMNVSTLYRKLNGPSDFYREEINQMCLILGIPDPKPVFFANIIA